MTLEELADLTADKLEKLTDKELEDILKPYFIHTRPELVVRAQPKKQEPQVYLSPQKKAALALLAAEGMDLGFMQRKFKKK